MFKADLKSYLLFSSSSILKYLRLSSKIHILPGIIVFPSDNCNLNCVMCDEGEEFTNRSTMQIETFYKMIQEISCYKFKPRVHLSGFGEPLIYRYINEMMKCCNDNIISWSMTTNGYLLSEYAENIVKYACSAINVSLHGMEKEHNFITGKSDAYERVINGLHRLANVKKSKNRVKPLIAINCVISSINIHTLDRMLDEMVKLPVNSITFQHLMFSKADLATENDTRVIKDKACLDQLERFVGKIGSMRNGIKINVFPGIMTGDIAQYYNPTADTFNQSCILPWLGIRMFPNGDVGMCGRRFGNLNENELSEILNNKEAREFRAEVKQGKINYSGCFRCCHRHYY